MCDFMKENFLINREWGEGYVRDVRNVFILLFIIREKCINVVRVFGIWRFYDIFLIVWYILKGFDFWKILIFEFLWNYIFYLMLGR